MSSPDPDRYFVELATAYVRGELGLDSSVSPEEAFAAGRGAGLRLYRFKRGGLPRVSRVLGLLRGLWPSDLLDVGSGRGTFLWPLLDERADLRVTTLERSPLRAAQLAALTRGGVARLQVLFGDVARAPLAEDSVDGATALEVLEHLVDPAAAARELVRVARRFVLVSVPSKPDDNPEHLHLFSPGDLEQLFLSAGARRVDVEHVLNHRVAVVLL